MRFSGLTLASAWLVMMSAAGRSESGNITVYSGMCDASAVAALDAGLFVAADDEDNVLRIFDRAQPGMPVSQLDLSGFLQVDERSPETDLEGAARIGNRIYWITSHGRNAKGKERPNRQRFFLTEIIAKDGRPSLVPTGIAYRQLLRDLASDPRLARFNLAAAAEKAPKESGALNIEGLSAMPGGRLLIGFRNPIPEGKALLVPLLNPDAVIGGAPARFGDPILLDLGGLGIRGIEFERDRYVIIAGPYNEGGAPRLYSWRGGGSAPLWHKEIDLTGFKPEALLLIGESDSVRCELVSDDGTLSIDGKECKRLKDPALKRFRTLGVHLPPAR